MGEEGLTFVNLSYRLLLGTKVQSGFWFAKDKGVRNPCKYLLERDTRTVNFFRVQVPWWRDPGHKLHLL